MNKIECSITNERKSLKIMGDYCSTGIWRGKYGAMIEPEILPISKTLQKRIKDWGKSWDLIFSKKLNKEFEYLNINKDIDIPLKIKKSLDEKFYNSKKFLELQKEQKIIAKLLKKHLGKEYDIYIFDEMVIHKFNNNKNFLYKI